MLMCSAACLSERTTCEEKVAGDFAAFSCDSFPLLVGIGAASGLSAENTRFYYTLPLLNCARELAARENCKEKSNILP